MGLDCEKIVKIRETKQGRGGGCKGGAWMKRNETKRGERESRGPGGACKSAHPQRTDKGRRDDMYKRTGAVSNPGSEARISEETFGNRGTQPPFRKRDFNQILPFHQFLLLRHSVFPSLGKHSNACLEEAKRGRENFAFFLTFFRRGSITQFAQLSFVETRFRVQMLSWKPSWLGSNFNQGNSSRERERVLTSVLKGNVDARPSGENTKFINIRCWAEKRRRRRDN